MKDREIIASAIEKAIANKWIPSDKYFFNDLDKDLFEDIKEAKVLVFIDVDSPLDIYIIKSKGLPDIFIKFTVYNLIDHPFAKAFFGEEPHIYIHPYQNTEGRVLNEWQYRIQEAVLEKNIIKYYERFL